MAFYEIYKFKFDNFITGALIKVSDAPIPIYDKYYAAPISSTVHVEESTFLDGILITPEPNTQVQTVMKAFVYKNRIIRTHA